MCSKIQLLSTMELGCEFWPPPRPALPLEERRHHRNAGLAAVASYCDTPRFTALPQISRST